MSLTSTLGVALSGAEPRRLPRLVKNVAADVFKNDDLGTSAETAYHALLAFFPFLLFLGSALAGLSWLIDKDTLIDELAGQVEGTAPDDVTSTFRRVLDDLLNKGSLTLAIVGGTFAVWSGSNAIVSLIKGPNKIHNATAEAGALEQRARALAFLGVFFAAFVACQLLIQGSSYLGDEVGALLGVLIQFGAWVTALALTALSVGLFYRYAPADRDNHAETITVGGLVFALSWLLFNVVYTLYLSVFGGPTSALGIIGFVVLLMVWFFWTGFSILLGAEVDHRLSNAAEAQGA